MSKAIAQMERATEAAAAGAEQSAWASEGLGTQSQKLESIVQSLDAMVGN